MKPLQNPNHRTLIVDGERFAVSVEQIENKCWKASGTFRSKFVEVTGPSESSSINALERTATQKLRNISG